MPVEVVRQVARGDIMKAPQPALHPLEVGVYVLHLRQDRASYLLPRTQIDKDMRDIFRAPEYQVDGMCIDDQQHIRIEHGKHVPVQLQRGHGCA